MSALVPRRVHPIERESWRVLRSLVDTSHLPPLSRAVAERVVHAAAEPDWVDDLVLDEAALESGRQALAAEAPIVADSRMVAAGVTAREVEVPLADPRAPAPVAGDTRSAAAMRWAAAEVGPGAVWMVGNAPTALDALLVADAAPALVVGLPVGFVGAVEAKAALRVSGLPAVTNRGVRGGSAVAAAVLNALLYHDPDDDVPPPPAAGPDHEEAT